MDTGNADFIPASDDAIIGFLANYGEVIAEKGALVGLTATEITEQQELASSTKADFEAASVKKAAYREGVQKKKVLRKTAIKLIRNMAVRIKRAPGYTDDIGAALGILRTSTASSTSTSARSILRPAIKATAFPTYIEISFYKYGQTGVSVFSRVKGSEEWAKLISGCTESPYRDSRALQQAGVPEIREYKALYWENGTETGQESDIVFTVLKGQ